MGATLVDITHGVRTVLYKMIKFYDQTVKIHTINTIIITLYTEKLPLRKHFKTILNRQA